MALDGASDEVERQSITSFWDRHLPIMMAPNGDYDYLAIALGQGAVVQGYASDGEEVSHVADSFEQWLLLLGQALQDPAKVSNAPLALRMMSRNTQ